MLRLIDTPAEVLGALNKRFPIDPSTWQYFTFLCATIDTDRQEVRYSTAGHPGPVLVSGDRPPKVLEAVGFPIGLFPDVTYEEFRAPLTPGDRIVFYSDGVTDTMNGDDETFGYARFLNLLLTRRDDDLETTVDAIRTSIIDWAKDGKPQDDVSVLVLELAN
jgi:sigma-B regulation protein RsbU (phosphoserine phosphatase)